MLELAGPVEGKRVLDLGCGDGLLATEFAKRGASALGVDIDCVMLRAAAARPTPRGCQPARLVRGRIEQLPFRHETCDVVVAVTVFCLVSDQAVAVREAARILRPGGRLVIGDLGRWNAWAALRRVKAWRGSCLWRSAHFSTAANLSRLAEGAGLTVEAVRGSVYYPRIGMLARPLSVLDQWLGPVTTVGAAFIALAARKPAADSLPERRPREDGRVWVRHGQARGVCAGGSHRNSSSSCIFLIRFF